VHPCRRHTCALVHLSFMMLYMCEPTALRCHFMVCSVTMSTPTTSLFRNRKIMKTRWLHLMRVCARDSILFCLQKLKPTRATNSKPTNTTNTLKFKTLLVRMTSFLLRAAHVFLCRPLCSIFARLTCFKRACCVIFFLSLCMCRTYS
jgi:hypothetical protein